MASCSIKFVSLAVPVATLSDISSSIAGIGLLFCLHGRVAENPGWWEGWGTFPIMLQKFNIEDIFGSKTVPKPANIDVSQTNKNFVEGGVKDCLERKFVCLVRDGFP